MSIRSAGLLESPGVMVHPNDAVGRGIKDGDAVRVFSDRGSFEVIARSTMRYAQAW
jgi:anaerobic selenocysteine-containing dehydrogenase